MSPVAVAIESKQAELPMAVLLRRQSGALKRRFERKRGDSLPELTRYRDDGCDIHPACLTCPLPRCRYDEKGGLRGMMNAYRDQQIAALRDTGVTSEELSERFGLSRRTIFRILEMQAYARMQDPGLKTQDSGLEVRCA